MKKRLCLSFLAVCLFVSESAFGDDWQVVYSESFDKKPPGAATGSAELPGWEGGSAAGVVFDGMSKAKHFMVAASAWTSFNQGPILNVDLSAVPHDRVRIKFDLYTFGDWRGLQRASGGPLHRLMFFDNKATPGFSFDTNFSSNPKFAQSWPAKNPTTNPALTMAVKAEVDATGRFGAAHRWPIEFEYPSDAKAMRFAILCGAAAGSGKPMPPFGIDNVRIAVRSTAPKITLANRPAEQSKQQGRTDGSRITFDVETNGHTSLGVYDSKTGRLVRTLLRGEALPIGTHSALWDGFDDRGRQLEPATYQWRAVTTPGFTARYLTTIGINPPGGEHPVPRRSWVGDHRGAGIVDVDQSGVYIGSPTTEGLMMCAKIDTENQRMIWTREQFYQSGRLTRVATSGDHVFLLHPNGKLRRLNKDNGRVEAEWSVSSEDNACSDVDAHQQNLVVADRKQNRLRWISTTSGKVLGEAELPSPVAVAATDTAELGAAFAASGNDIYAIRPGAAAERVASLSGAITAMDYDPTRRELWVALDGHRVVRLDERFQVAQRYGKKPRTMGPFDPTQFAGIYDIAADLDGGFYVGEPDHPPRRIAHLARDGSVTQQWFGGMSFYVNAVFDPQDPTRLIGLAPEGSVNVYRIDFESGKWGLEATYQTGRLGDSMFPFAASFRAIRRNGQLFLYHRVVPAVLKLDAESGRAVPVAIAGVVRNRGRSFFQFAGTGRDGYPKPWVAAAEHHGYQDLSKTPKLYSWADANGNGEFEPAEFRFYPNAKGGVSFHNPGDFASNGDYIGSAKTNETNALYLLPVEGWEGPRKSAPRWNWDRLTSAGEIVADPYGYGSPRGVSVAPDNSVAVAYQAGIMIREHGQYQGGGWPEMSQRGSRILSFGPNHQPLWAAGRQSKQAAEANTGVLYYPMQTTFGPNRSIVVNDQTKQPAQVWTHDGLYAGGFFDHRTDDGRDARFYQIHGDDNQGATVVTTADGRTYWLMPYQGHNRLYEISGWRDWRRQSGDITRPQPANLRANGRGLNAVYHQGPKRVFKTIEPPIYYQRFGAEPHATEVTPHYKVEWTGHLEPPLTDRFRFRSLLGKGERIAIWIDGILVHANGFRARENIDRFVQLSAGARRRIRIEYINPDGRAELKLLWSSTVVDPQPVPATVLYPEP